MTNLPFLKRFLWFWGSQWQFLAGNWSDLGFLSLFALLNRFPMRLGLVVTILSLKSSWFGPWQSSKRNFSFDDAPNALFESFFSYFEAFLAVLKLTETILPPTVSLWPFLKRFLSPLKFPETLSSPRVLLWSFTSIFAILDFRVFLRISVKFLLFHVARVTFLHFLTF